MNTVRPVVAGGTGQNSVANVQTAFKIPPFDGAANISGTWEWQDDVAAVFGNDADASISWVSADSALALKVGATARIEATSAGADVTGDLTVTGDVSGATASGAMVSTDISSDTGSTTKIPCVDAVEDYVTGLVPSAWVAFNGTGTPTILAAKNVSSITDNGTGDYVVNFTNPMASTNFAAIGSSNAAQTRTGGARTVNSVNVITEGDSGTNEDATYISVVVYGALA